MLNVRYPASGSLPQSGLLHAGEAESILLAIELNADWLLVDDLDARRLARQNIEKVNLKIGVKGTLGVIVTAAQAGLITTAQGIESIQAMENHPDIWLAPALCEVVVKILKRLSIVIDIPSETLVALKVTEAEIGETLRIAAAVKLFELGRLSSGAAARLAGVPRVVFLARLADYGVDTFNLTEEQLQRETRLA